jgi:uncharacterized protein involved in exopolysaccharide biosynthesis
MTTPSADAAQTRERSQVIVVDDPIVVRAAPPRPQETLPVGLIAFGAGVLALALFIGVAYFRRR